MKIMDSACKNFQLDLQFLNTVVKRGVASKIFHGKDVVVPYNSVADEICLFLEEVKSKLSAIKTGKEDASKFEQTRQELGRIKSILEQNMRTVNEESRTAHKYIEGPNKMDVEAFKKFSIKLASLNEEFKKSTRDYISAYEEFYRIENASLKKFVKDNVKLFYYALSAFNIVESMNKVLINLPNLNVDLTESKNVGPRIINFFTRRMRSLFGEPKESFGYVVSGLATRLFMHCITHESTAYEGLAKVDFKNLMLKNTFLPVPVSAETPSQGVVRENLVQESGSFYKNKILIPLKRLSTNTLQ